MTEQVATHSIEIPRPRPGDDLDYEVVVIGAGVGGIYQIKKLLDLGVSAVVLEGEADLGGTWFRNRYPGARFDSESYTYGYSFSRELLDEWHWKERFSPQPENLRYLNYVTDKFGLREHMQFDSRVEAMVFDEADDVWRLQLAHGRAITCRFVITALGPLSTPTLPSYPGMDRFRGESFHTFHWPEHPVELSGKRVGVIGTGATGVQVIGEIADKVGHLTVFQRRPNWTAPLNNGPISDDEMAAIRARYDEIFENCRNSPGGFEHEPDRRGFYTLSREERLALWDRLYDEPGFGIWLQQLPSRSSRTRRGQRRVLGIHRRPHPRPGVDDPGHRGKTHSSRSRVSVCNACPSRPTTSRPTTWTTCISSTSASTPIERGDGKVWISGRASASFELDLIVYATGFDALTGGYDRIDIRGVGGVALRDRWELGPSTFLGVMISGFPNLLMVSGPQSGSVSTNFPRGIESGVDWISELLSHARAEGYRRIEADADAEVAWTEHVAETYRGMLLRKAQGWFTGYNSNVEGHEAGTVRHVVYNGGGPKYVAKLSEVAASGYEGIRFS